TGGERATAGRPASGSPPPLGPAAAAEKVVPNEGQGSQQACSDRHRGEEKTPGHVVEHDDEGIDSGRRVKGLGEMHRHHRQADRQRRREHSRSRDFHHQQPDHRGHPPAAPHPSAPRAPPMSGRGCAASISGEPMTSTIEVANGTNMSGKAARSDNSSISAMATAPPAAPAMTAIRRCMAGPGSRKASTPPRDDLSVGFVHPKKHGRRAGRNRRPPIVLMAYLRLAIAVRSNLPVATKVALHQLEPNPPGLIPLKSPENRAVWSLVKALQSALL